MSFSLFYIVHRAIFRFTDFFHNWYINGSRTFFNSARRELAALRRVLGGSYLSRPLVRFLSAALMIAFAAAYAVWIAVPFLILLGILWGRPLFYQP